MIGKPKKTKKCRFSLYVALTLNLNRAILNAGPTPKQLGPLENDMKKKDRVERICDTIGNICLVLALVCLLAIPVTYELWLAGVIK